MEDDNHTGKSTSGLLENLRQSKEREKSRQDGLNDSRKSTTKSMMDRKYSDRYVYTYINRKGIIFYINIYFSLVFILLLHCCLRSDNS